MHTQGIIVGCDSNQEWLLPWWWEHYSKHNSYPVAFADFGMTPNAAKWCQSKGIYLSISANLAVSFKNDVSPERKDLWESFYGEGFWPQRAAWFKKPLALLASPFPYGIWIDLDCEIKENLDPLFNCLGLGAEIALAQEPAFGQKIERAEGLLLEDEVGYNSGVIVFKQSAAVLHEWAKLAVQSNDRFIGDQHALSRAIFEHKIFVFDLPRIYNWHTGFGDNPEAVILHFAGPIGKQRIIKKMGDKAYHDFAKIDS